MDEITAEAYQQVIQSVAKRNEYWNHFIERWVVAGEGGGQGVTGPRLQKIKERLFEDDVFWFDIIDRHNGEKRTPEEMKAANSENYNHCQGNFWGNVVALMGRYGIIKILGRQD